MSKRAAPLGLNEALILASLTAEPETSIADVAARVEADRTIDEGTIYVALQRMVGRGYVTKRTTAVLSGDGKTREIGIYGITGEGAIALDSFERIANALPRLRLAVNGA